MFSGLLRQGEDLNVVLGEISTVPTVYREDKQA